MGGRYCRKVWQNRCNSRYGADWPLLVCPWEVPAGQWNETSICKSSSCKKTKELDDKNPNKNDRKDPKTIAALVNEGRFSYPYLPTGIYAEIRSLSKLRFQTQEELTRLKN